MFSPRKIVERLSRDKVLKRHLFVDGKTIPILVSPDAQLKYLKVGTGAFDNDLIAIAEKYVKKDSNVWDVGANVGVFTFAASEIAQCGNVVSIEADIWLAGLIRKTAQYKLYTDRNIFVLPAAISNANSVAKFMIADRGRQSNALEKAGGRSEMGGVREMQHVPTLTLDTLCNNFPIPDFIKIDVEGAELMVLQGSKKVINEVRPVFYIEIGQDVSKKILEIFNTAGYSAFDPDGKPLVDFCTENTLFIPNEKLNNDHPRN